MKNNFKGNYAKYLCGIITEEQFYELKKIEESNTTPKRSSPAALGIKYPNPSISKTFFLYPFINSYL